MEARAVYTVSPREGDVLVIESEGPVSKETADQVLAHLKERLNLRQVGILTVAPAPDARQSVVERRQPLWQRVWRFFCPSTPDADAGAKAPAGAEEVAVRLVGGLTPEVREHLRKALGSLANARRELFLGGHYQSLCDDALKQFVGDIESFTVAAQEQIHAALGEFHAARQAQEGGAS